MDKKNRKIENYILFFPMKLKEFFIILCDIIS